MTVHVTVDSTTGTTTEIEVDVLRAYNFGYAARDQAGVQRHIAELHLEVEKVNMPKAKASCPDIIGATAWLLDEVAEHWDDCTLHLWGQNPDGTEELIQSGTVGHLLPPADMQRVLAERSGTALAPGTVILSGTLDGEPTPGKRAWRAELADPHTGRTIALGYSLHVLDQEL